MRPPLLGKPSPQGPVQDQNPTLGGGLVPSVFCFLEMNVRRGVWLLVAVAVAACAPARIGLDPGARARLPSASVVHVVVYPTDPPPLMSATAIGVGSLFGPVGGAVAAARAATVGKELMARHNVENLSVQLADRLV